jgi:arylsulfatase A-like enzyme
MMSYPTQNPPAARSKKPNVVYFLVDDLGMGELSSYNGCSLRGATTARIDAFARQGMMLFNFAPKTRCTPSRMWPQFVCCQVA